MKRRSLLEQPCWSILAVDRETIVNFGLLNLDSEYLADQRLQGRPKVLQMVRIQQRINRRIQMRQDNREERKFLGNITFRTECLDAVYRVEWQPADHEEQHDYRKVLCCLDFAFSGRTENTKHCSSLRSGNGHQI